MDLPGGRVRPDIAFPRWRLAVFVDGCYWHGCTEHRSIPASNTAFWRTKIDATRRRDIEQEAWLREAGWTVLRIWEHEPIVNATRQVAGILEGLRSESLTR